jgi:hypothetical protein
LQRLGDGDARNGVKDGACGCVQLQRNEKYIIFFFVLAKALNNLQKHKKNLRRALSLAEILDKKLLGELNC